MKKDSAIDNISKKAGKNLTKPINVKTEENTIITDPFGSWTGVDLSDNYEKPIQDVDDL